MLVTLQNVRNNKLYVCELLKVIKLLENIVFIEKLLRTVFFDIQLRQSFFFISTQLVC